MHFVRIVSSTLALLFAATPGLAAAKDRGASDKVVRVIAKGDSEEDARLNALREAVRKGCGTSVVDATLREEQGAAGQTSATSTNQTEYFTGGRISSSRVFESSEEEDGKYRMTLDVVLAGCRSDGKITTDSVRPGAGPPKRKAPDKNAVYSRELTVTVAYEVPAAPISSYALKAIALAVAQSFSASVIKADLAAKLNSTDPIVPLSTAIEVLSSRDLPSTDSEYGLQLSTRVTLTGVSEEIDGNLVPDRPWRAASRNLRLSARHSHDGGFSYYINPAEQNLVIFSVEKQGRAFGKLIPGDVIVGINSAPLRVDENFDRFFVSETSMLPMKLSLRRGAVNTVVILR